MVRARMKGRFPVEYEAAKALVQRGTLQVDGGFVWSHDPRLLAPSVARLTEAEVRSFLATITQPVMVCLADGGIATAATRARLNYLKKLQLVEVVGGHHPHLQQRSLGQVSDAITRFYRTSDKFCALECTS